MSVLPPLPDVDRSLSEDNVSLGELGLVEVKLTDQEEAVLNEPVPEAEVLLKPHSSFPPAYLSHPSYTRWFNRAFGRLGWSLVPASKPMKASGAVVCAYLLHIHGKPVALAWGEQEFHDNNKYQSYGDALEATVASALRRCAKHLGMGLELWDKDWTSAFHMKHPEMFRRAIELGREERGSRSSSSSSSRPAQSASTAPSAAPAQPAQPEPAHHRHSGQPITEKQARRLWVIATNSGRGVEQVEAWIKRAYRVDSMKDVTRDIYDAICNAVESVGDLPPGRA